MQRASVRCTVGPLVPVHLSSSRAGRQTRSIPVQGLCTGRRSKSCEVLTLPRRSYFILEPRNVTLNQPFNLGSEQYAICNTQGTDTLYQCRYCTQTFFVVGYFTENTASCQLFRIAVIQAIRARYIGTYIHYQLSSVVEGRLHGHTIYVPFVSDQWTFRFNVRARCHAFLKKSIFRKPSVKRPCSAQPPKATLTFSSQVRYMGKLVAASSSVGRDYQFLSHY